MCGLTGLLSSESSNNIVEKVNKMTSMLVHRGPNNEGFWSKGNIGFGHRRLSIVDLSKAGTQPISSMCGRFIMVYNGEIYNHLKLRHRRGHIEMERAFRY